MHNNTSESGALSEEPGAKITTYRLCAQLNHLAGEQVSLPAVAHKQSKWMCTVFESRRQAHTFSSAMLSYEGPPHHHQRQQISQTSLPGGVVYLDQAMTWAGRRGCVVARSSMLARGAMVVVAVVAVVVAVCD